MGEAKKIYFKIIEIVNSSSKSFDVKKNVVEKLGEIYCQNELIISISELANSIKDIVGYKGRVKFDLTKPDGMTVKLLDANRLSRLGWRAETPLKEGLSKTYDWYKALFNQDGK